MYKDNLEKFINENREAFDTEMPSLKVWAEIDKQLEEQKPKQRFSVFSLARMAAAVVVLLVSGAVIGNYVMKQQQGEATVALEQISPEYAEMVQYYSQEFDTKYQQLVSLDAEETIADDLKQLDHVMEELQAELLEAPKGSEEQIVSSLIISYQTRVKILERVLERIHKNNRKSLNPEDDEISI